MPSTLTWPADGYLLEMVNEGLLGDPQDRGLVVARLPTDLVVRFESHQLGAAEIAPVRIYNFSNAAAVVELSVAGSGFSLVDDLDAPGASSRSIVISAGGAAVDVEVAFTASAWGSSSGLLSVGDNQSSYAIALQAQAVDAGVGIPGLLVQPYDLAGFPPSSLYAGDTALYELQLTNNDDPGAPTSVFAIEHDCPLGWDIRIQPSALSLEPGETGAATLSVTPVSGEFPAVYGFEVTVIDALESAHTASGEAIYEVLTDSQPPSPPADLTAEGNHKRNKLLWTSATDNFTVAGYEVLRDGQRLGLTGTPSFTDRQVERDRVYLYAVRAFDAASNLSTEVSVTVRNGAVIDEGGSDGGGSQDDPPPVCSNTQPERGKRCSDGIDNDCDGLIDAADLDC